MVVVVVVVVVAVVVVMGLFCFFFAFVLGKTVPCTLANAVWSVSTTLNTFADWLDVYLWFGWRGASWGGGGWVVEGGGFEETGVSYIFMYIYALSKWFFRIFISS